MKCINLYIDESGNLGKKSGRFFLICALEIENSDKKAMQKRAGRVISRFKKGHGIRKTKELKGWALKTSDRLNLLSKILYRGIKVRYIVIDLDKTTMLLKSADDKNACYNYLLQLIIKSILDENKKINEINLYLDNRTVKVGERYCLNQYLYNKFVLEKFAETNTYNYVKFHIYYLESESSYLIQFADIIANSLYKKYDSLTNEFYNIIKPYIIFESNFPFKDFGK